MINKKSLLATTKKWAVTSMAILGLGIAGGMYFNNNTHASADTIRPTVINNPNANQNNPYPQDGEIVKPNVTNPNKNVKPKLIPNNNANQNNPYSKNPKDGTVIKPQVIMPGGKNIKPTVVYPNYNPNTNGTKNGRYNGQIIIPKLIMPKHNGQSKHYHHATITKITVPKHFRWFYITKKCLAHNHLELIGKPTDYSYVLRPKHNVTLRILNLYKITRHGNVGYQYEVNINGGHYFVTGNHRYTPNAYYQTYDLKNANKKHGTYRIKVIQRCNLYRRAQYNRKTYVKGVRYGKILRAKKIVNIGLKGDYQTRFMLKNRFHGHNLYITSNKNWVKLL